MVFLVLSNELSSTEVNCDPDSHLNSGVHSSRLVGELFGGFSFLSKLVQSMTLNSNTTTLHIHSFMKNNHQFSQELLSS